MSVSTSKDKPNPSCRASWIRKEADFRGDLMRKMLVFILLGSAVTVAALILAQMLNGG
jgi:hypothetical protein